MNTKIKEEQFCIEWTFEFMEMIDGVKDESAPSNINLVNGLATFTSENFLISFEKALSYLLHESLMFGVSR